MVRDRELLKILRRTVVLEGWANRFGRKALREIEDAYREMLCVMVDYTLKHGASQSTLHKIFYNRFREKYPWLPTRVVKGCYRDAARRARSFRWAKKKGRAYTDKPEVRRVTITYSDSQDWRLEDGVIKLRTHMGWVELHYRNHKQLHRYLYSGWKPSSELRLKLSGGRILIYLTLAKEFEVSYNPDNAVAVDINENNATLAVFVNRRLHEIYRIETSIGRIIIAYSERRKITGGRSTGDRDARKSLRRLGEGGRKGDVIYKTAEIFEEIARRYGAVLVIGNAQRGKDRMASNAGGKSLRHRIHQWCVSKLVEVLNSKPLHIVKESEAYSSSKDPFSGRPIKRYTLSVIRVALRGGGRVKVIKIQMRLARSSNGLTLDRDVIGAINIGLRYPKSDGSTVAFPSTEPHGVWVKLMTPHRGLTPLTEIQIFTNTTKHR